MSGAKSTRIKMLEGLNIIFFCFRSLALFNFVDGNSMKKTIFSFAILMMFLTPIANAADVTFVSASMTVGEAKGVFSGAEKVVLSLIKSDPNDPNKPYTQIKLQYTVSDKDFSYQGEIFTLPDEEKNYNAEIKLDDETFFNIFMGEKSGEQPLWHVMVCMDGGLGGRGVKGEMALMGTPQQEQK